MDLSLWDPPIYEDEDREANRQPDFCFWKDPDPVENDAANERACIQVLRILIKKADTDIAELEEDIILIQSQLALTDEAWSETCFTALREKIKGLEMSIEKLKNENPQSQQDQQEGGGVQSQINGEPAEKIHGILKSLLEKYFLPKDKQITSSDVENLVSSQSKDEIRFINSEAELCGAKTSGQTTTPLCLEAQKGDDGENEDQDLDTIILDWLIDISTDAFAESNQRDLDKIDTESNRKQGTTENDSTNETRKRTYTPENDKQTNAVLRNASGITSSYEAGSNSRNWGSSNDSEGISTEAEMLGFTNEIAISVPFPKSTEATQLEAYKLAHVVPDGMPDAVEQVANKSITKQLMEEKDADQANKKDPKKQSVRMGRKGTISPPKMKNDEWLNDRECTIAESFRELLNNKRKEARKPETKATQIPQVLEQMQNTEVAGPEKSESNLWLKRELVQKHCSHLDPQTAQEPCLAVEMELNPSTKNLQNWKSTITDKHAGNSSTNRNFRRQTLPDYRRSRSPIAAPDASMTSDSQSEKKRKHSLISPVIKENKELENIQTIARRHKDTASDIIQKDHLINNSNTANEVCVDKPLKSLSCSASSHHEPDMDLEFLPMDTLRRLAKINNLTGYSKLRKEELLKLLKAKSRDADWREI